MTPIILISYFFPPIGMAGAARALGLFRHLPEFGNRPYVVTVKDIVYPAHDYTMLNEEDEKYIIRTESLDPSRLLYRLGRRTAPDPGVSRKLSSLATPDLKKLWASSAIRACSKLIKERGIKLIVTTSPPPSIHAIGLALKKKHGLPWVADFRDQWITRPIESVYNSEKQKRRAHELLSECRAGADMLTAVNKSVGEYVGATQVIHNAADPKTFSLWDKKSTFTDSVLRIGYLGTTDSRQTIQAFTIAMAGALDHTGLSASDVQVNFVGKVNSAMLHESFEQASIAESLKLSGYLPRLEAVSELANVDTLLLTLHDDKLDHVTGSKIFDYLVSGKRIIAVAPKRSELAELAGSNGASIFEEAETERLREYLTELLRQRQIGSLSPALSREELAERRKRYGWPEMARKFADVLNELEHNA